MVNIEEGVTVIATIMASIVAITGVINLILKRREMRPHFRLFRRFENVDKPIESHSAIVILHPDKVIEKCMVYYDGVLLPWKETKGVLQYERYFGAGEGETFRIPKNAENEDAEVIVKDGKTRLRKPVKFKDLPEG